VGFFLSVYRYRGISLHSTSPIARSIPLIGVFSFNMNRIIPRRGKAGGNYPWMGNYLSSACFDLA